MQEFNQEEFNKAAMPEADTVCEAVITQVNDGLIKEFVSNIKGWNNPNQPCVYVLAEAKYKGMGTKVDGIFAYSKDGKKKIYGERSNLGKFEMKYKGLPKVGMKIKVQANEEGFFRILFK